MSLLDYARAGQHNALVAAAKCASRALRRGPDKSDSDARNSDAAIAGAAEVCAMP